MFSLLQAAIAWKLGNPGATTEDVPRDIPTELRDLLISLVTGRNLEKFIDYRDALYLKKKGAISLSTLIAYLLNTDMYTRMFNLSLVRYSAPNLIKVFLRVNTFHMISWLAFEGQHEEYPMFWDNFYKYAPVTYIREAINVGVITFEAALEGAFAADRPELLAAIHDGSRLTRYGFLCGKIRSLKCAEMLLTWRSVPPTTMFNYGFYYPDSAVTREEIAKFIDLCLEFVTSEKTPFKLSAHGADYLDRHKMLEYALSKGIRILKRAINPLFRRFVTWGGYETCVILMKYGYKLPRHLEQELAELAEFE